MAEIEQKEGELILKTQKGSEICDVFWVGKEAIDAVFCGSGLIPWSDMKKPAKDISLQMTIFLRDIVLLISAHLWRTQEM